MSSLTITEVTIIPKRERRNKSARGVGKVDGPPIAAVGVEFLLNEIDDGRGGGHGNSYGVSQLNKHGPRSSGSGQGRARKHRNR